MQTLYRTCITVVTLMTSIPAAAQTTALVGARLIDGTGRVFDSGTVVIDGGRIAAAGPTASTVIPAGATRIDLKGKTVMPGLVNAHGHVAATRGLESSPSFYTRDNLLRQLRTYARYGVTSVFSLGDDDAAGFTLRNEQSTGTLDRTRLFVAGPIIAGDTATDIVAMIAKVDALKPDLLKIRVDDNLGTTKKMLEPAWRAAITEGHRKGYRVAAHIFYLDDAKKIAAAGGDMIAHSVRDRAVDEAFIADLKAHDICYSPTLMREVSTFAYVETPSWVTDPFFLKGVEPEIPNLLSDPARQARQRSGTAWTMGQQYKAGLAVAKKNLKTLSDKGVRIAMGTDTGPPGRFQGFFEHLELEMMVESGLTPMQAIVSATGDAARCHKATGLGTLSAGSVADVLVLSADPLENIHNTRTIEQVWIAGKKAF
jgi:imidazolonepropionase-like amidohydrolase